MNRVFAGYRLACGYPLQNLKADLGHRSLEESGAYIGVVASPSQEMRNLSEANTN